jgi:hypothetical protein
MLALRLYLQRPGRRLLGVVLAVAALSSATACVFRHQPSTPEDDSDVVTLTVINHHPLDVVIFNVRQGYRERIGDVTAASRSSFRLHLRRFPGSEVQFYADPIGRAQGVTSEVLHLFPGQAADWTLETELARSSIAVRD